MTEYQELSSHWVLAVLEALTICNVFPVAMTSWSKQIDLIFVKILSNYKSISTMASM